MNHKVRFERYYRNDNTMQEQHVTVCFDMADVVAYEQDGERVMVTTHYDTMVLEVAFKQFDIFHKEFENKMTHDEKINQVATTLQ